MDPLFERRELTKKVNIHARFLQQNIQTSLLAQLKHQFQGKCMAEGYIQKDSLTIVKYSLGRPNMLTGGVDYHVSFQADICMPHAGQRFKVPITLRSKIGLHAETTPLKILIPRDLHIGSPAFESVKEGEQVEFEVVGTPQFKQGDEYIIVVGKLVIQEPTTPPFAPSETPAFRPDDFGELEVPPFQLGSGGGSGSGGGEEKKIVITASTTPSADKPARRRLKRGPDNTE
jgi:DNA-directed RNA polymerase subunit E'/Rpb7